MPGRKFESSQPHHAVVCYRRFPEGVRKAPNWRGSVRRFVLRDGIVTVGTSFVRIFLWPRNPVSPSAAAQSVDVGVPRSLPQVGSTLLFWGTVIAVPQMVPLLFIHSM